MTQNSATAAGQYLFSPLQIREVHFRNRIAVSPMCQYSSVDGFANDWHFVHLGSRAVGGAALVMTEASAVLADGRISPQDHGACGPTIPTLFRVFFRFIEDHGAVPAMQLAHAGRKASTAAPWNGGGALAESEQGWRPIFAPSAIPFSPKSPTPVPLDEAEIARVVRAFGEAAARAR